MKIEEYISEVKIINRVKELAIDINDLIKDDEVVLIGILKGAFVFLADLARALKNKNILIDFIATESYTGIKSSGILKITRDLSLSVAGKRVIIVEDILDTGFTMANIIRYLKDNHKASDVKLCVLLDKPEGRMIEVKPDFVGFKIFNRFVVGYGLDYNEQFRNLPYIAILDF